MSLSSRRLLFAFVLLVASAGLTAAETSPFADKPCLSYSSFRDKELRWGDAPLDDFGPVAVKFDSTGVRTLRPVPAACVHPRILCSPDDLPDITVNREPAPLQ